MEVFVLVWFFDDGVVDASFIEVFATREAAEAEARLRPHGLDKFTIQRREVL